MGSLASRRAREIEHPLFPEVIHFRLGRRLDPPNTLVSRATDADGIVQPTRADLSRKKTFLQANAQFPRKIMIA